MYKNSITYLTSCFLSVLAQPAAKCKGLTYIQHLLTTMHEKIALVQVCPSPSGNIMV